MSLQQGGYVAPLLIIAREPNDSEIKAPGTLTFIIDINTNLGTIFVRVHRPDHPDFSDERGPGLHLPFEGQANKEVEGLIWHILGPHPL